MAKALSILSLLLSVAFSAAQIQAPALPGAQRIGPSDRVYTGDQSSNTITVFNPYTNKVLGTIALGSERLSDDIGPQYVKAVNSHGLGFSRDGKYIVSISVTTNTVTVIRTLDNKIMSQTSVSRAPHEAFFTADNTTVWVACRGVSQVDIVDGISGGIIGHVATDDGPSKVLFSPDGKTAYVNHIRASNLSIIDVASKTVVAKVTGLPDTFSSDMMLSPDGTSIWLAHKMIGKVSVIDLRTRKIVTVLDTGLETNHPNFAYVDGVLHGYVTVAALNETKVYRQRKASDVPVFVGAIKQSGIEPHGLWSSPDGTRLFVVNEHSDTMDIINTATQRIIKTVVVGQESQALIYVAGAVTSGDGTQNLGRQGLDMPPVENKIIPVRGTKGGSALLTVRETNGLDMVQLIGRNLEVNTTYVMSASCHGCKGAQVPLLRFTGNPDKTDGCATAPQVLGFFLFMDVYDINSVIIKPVEGKR
ncbi:nitrous oxide reductase [Xylogone sp. PMI_703]|nr:nitrous oxide reductase [Xylogone sp. PMI_703]